MQLKSEARLAAGGRARLGLAGAGNVHHSDCSRFEPQRLMVWKRARWCQVGKIVCLDGSREPVLAVVHRHQQGTTSRISLPIPALTYAESQGCRWVYFRRDTTGQMWRMPIADVRQCPLGPAIGGTAAERYIEIAKMEPVPWRDWQWAAYEVRLGGVPAGNNQSQQLRLGGL